MRLNKPLILASQSKARREMLEGVGLRFEIVAADLDEADIIKKLLEEKKAPAEIAAALAQEKALAVAEKNPDALVIGGDQVLEFDGEVFNKAANVTEAKEKLKKLRGKEHHLISAVCVARGRDVLWAHKEEAGLRMHDFDDDFLDLYCERAGAALIRSVGAYELESVGAWLFENIKGDYFTILGIPLLPLLGFLRTTEGEA